jgi:hypothetical protein
MARARTLSLALAIGLIAVAASASAAAGVVKYDTKLTLDLHAAGSPYEIFRYFVQSEGGKVCERGRRVVLFEVRPGADRRLGTARSKYRSGLRRGVARISMRKEPDFPVFIAKVRREVHDEFVCGGDRSKVHDDR